MNEFSRSRRSCCIHFHCRADGQWTEASSIALSAYCCWRYL